MMLSYVGKRLLQLIPVLLGMTFIVFMIIRAIPGNPAQIILGQQATKEAVEALTVKLGLDNPWYIQYFKYLGGLFKGDLGESMKTRTPVADEIWPYLAATFELALFAIIIAVVIGINAGIISAWFQNSWFDYTAMILALVGVSMPIFWLGLMGQWVFALELQLATYDGKGTSSGSHSLHYEFVCHRHNNPRTIRPVMASDSPSNLTGTGLGDYSDGDYRTDDAVKYAGSHAIRLCPNSSG